MKKHLLTGVLISALRFIYIFFFFVICCHNITAQGNYELKVILSGNNNKNLLNSYSYKKSFSDSISLRKELFSLLKALNGDGYMAASVDSIHRDSIYLNAYLNPGNQYHWIMLSSGNVPEDFLSSAGWKSRNFRNKIFKPDNFIKLNQRLLSYAENNGYPFASVTTDSISITDTTIKASLLLKKGSLIVVDSIVIKGKLKISDKYLYNTIGIKPGDVYNESKIASISKRLNEVRFLKEIKPFYVTFYKEKSKLTLYLDKKKNSNFDGIIGIAPNSQTSGKLMLTGEVNLNVENSFNRGELIDMKWRKLQLSSQDLKLGMFYPYLFNTPFGIDGKFNLFKNDTLYVTLSGVLGIRYLYKGNDYLKFFYESKSSDLLSPEAYKSYTVLPDFADIKSAFYGIEIKKTNLDYILNPRRGYIVEIKTAAGNRKIIKNTAFNDSLYNNIALNTVQYKLEIEFDYYKTIYRNHVLRTGFRAASLMSENLFQNEFFKIGGLKSLRGFDEESLEASFYTLPCIEYRYLFEENSNFFIFYNQAFYKKKLKSSEISDHPLGFGLGVNFETKLGVFSLSYALGKQFNNPVDLKSAKLHFGIITYF